MGTDGQYARLVEALGDEAIAARAEWATNAARVASLAELRAELVRALGAASAAEWSERLGAAGVPVGPVLDVPGAFAQPQIAGGDFVGEMDAPGGVTRAMRTPLLVDGARPPIRSGPRRLGEDSAGLA